MDLGLKNKVVLIAGSSRGIGLAIAEAFLEEEAQVILTGRDEKNVKNAESFLVKKGRSHRVASFCADMTLEAEIHRVLQNTCEKFGRIDIAIANIGSGVGKSGWDLSRDEWQQMLNVNLLGGMAFAKSALPHLIQSRGNLIFISSIAGNEAIPAPIPYSAAKAALHSAMKNLSRMVGSQGVRVNAVSPGNILFPGGTWEAKLAERKDFFEQYINTEVPLQRFGRAEEIADAVTFLASERASFITGACLVVDGGQTRVI
ncbi:MAG: SDR family oxidoreductase [Chlamydiae bacterium]|nr:SDR family oxidoreductase [Chlamydiota bacterium]MBI3276237.1 SDR family oxidoreductase [Chlamydiota bacterium]